eukprot:CAMPEP_0194267312 /NCGR_PEP_ID=MMETSP0169-20130528/1865_1 /TAXON_ID=218684 /ORGANISM="Corethron pennatum, Strain L29A3" /LENGTH=407 /DNA_ID=CAMNT_0039008133 /DNA_START=102 /DNA_END=1325 /DNA_ORIENTATION=-
MVHSGLLYAAAAVLSAHPALAGEPTNMVFLPGLGCPHTYSPVPTVAGCIETARTLGIRYRGLSNDLTDNGRPRACFVDAVQSIARLGTNYGAADSFLCTRAQYVQQELAIDACPADYSPIYNGRRCASASKVLGLVYEKAGNGNDYPASDALCFVSLLNGDGTRTEHSRTQVNSNHFRRAAWICEWDRPATAEPTQRKTRGPTSGPTAGPTGAPTAAPVAQQRVAPATPAAAVTKRRGPLYLRQDRGVDICPAGYQPVTDTVRCGEASAHLGIEHVDWYDGDDEPGEIAVCFVSNVDENQVLDNLVFPSTTRVNSAHWDAAAWICEQSAYYVSNPGVEACPGQTQRIANPRMCKQATQALGVRFNPKRNGRDGTGPPHCVLKKDGAYKSGSVNNNQGPRDSIICSYP